MYVYFLESNTLVQKKKSGCDKALKSKKQNSYLRTKQSTKKSKTAQQQQ